MRDEHAEQPTPEALKDAKRHIAAAEAHERRVATLEQMAAHLDEQGDSARADEHRREANLERDAAREEWDRAEAIQGPTQFTEPKKGEPVEIPIPTRDAFLRNLEKVAPPPSR
jgi:hypothetical protein